MSDEELLRAIREDAGIAEMLVRFDFDLERAVNGPAEVVALRDGGALEMIAGDASGGAFLLAGPPAASRPVVYAGSEGEGGLIAPDLRTALALVVGLSSLHDATSMPLGDGAALREWLAFADSEIREDWPELDDDRARLRAALNLPSAEELLPVLHASAADDRYRPVSEAGDVYESMLG
ncbi:hypothetical protein ACFQY4_31110 [Catellatospora bangladeshensis]|uniref:Uncharacterized protein n=1 Tax=Catellatospora bangladeshensis TaxID=310355 RepID=A0A8J3JI03_9ACTN|nr:hypothetical protein [Catellatospora bangladeshensis]GIF85202.1 hypothetical protein Cba03nite_65510 [Catellatospora bangladeshensis]